MNELSDLKIPTDSDVPIPQDSGSAGTQALGPADIIPSFADSPLPKAIGGLGATQAKFMGGEIGATLLGVAVQQLADDLRETKGKLTEVSTKLESAREALSQSQVREAKLRGHLDAQSQSKNIRNVCLTAGLILLGIAFNCYGTQFEKYAYILAPVGAILTVVGWLPIRKGIE